ncbi:hypothetical protein GA0115251_106936 [Streptomyces sp. TverLS-915]|nr:hypothetical protein GA0115251_106936 [Streptomyces sp. TverLS-915]SCE40356.1 hypothetical protein GA0115252_146428 [Streptomyces sp. DfronAA-171]
MNTATVLFLAWFVLAPALLLGHHLIPPYLDEKDRP